MRLYTVKEAAQLVGVSTNTLYKYLDEDRIHAARGSAIQGRFRIPESALEEFLGIKLSQPEPVGAGSSRPLEESQITPITTGEETSPLPKTHLPIKFARILLILALLAILLDLFISRTISLPAQLSRLSFLLIMLLLAYSEGGYRRG